jgi:hypothetical protein
MLFEYYIDKIGTVFTKKAISKNQTFDDFCIEMFGPYHAICECSGKTLQEFFDDEFDLLTNELEPHNRKLITRFYNDPKCETIYWSLLEQYYGNNATGETYVYQPPKPKKFLGLF